MMPVMPFPAKAAMIRPDISFAKLFLEVNQRRHGGSTRVEAHFIAALFTALMSSTRHVPSVI